MGRFEGGLKIISKYNKAVVLMCSLLIYAMGSASPLGAQEAGKVYKLERAGLRLEMQALAPDVVRAFFIGRGFSAAEALMIARRGCVFRSAIGNAAGAAGAPEIAIDLRRWRIPGKDGGSTMRIREEWQKIWRERQIPEKARTAFYWALFPTEQNYGPMDYNWGMLTFGLAPGERFDLVLRWEYGDREQEMTLKGLQCAQ